MTSTGAREATTFEAARATLRAVLDTARARACTVNVIELTGPAGPYQRLSILYQRRAASAELPLAGADTPEAWRATVEAATRHLLAQLGLAPPQP